MAIDDIPDQSKVSDDYTVRIPPRIREELDVSPGDSVEWHVTDGELAVEMVEQEYGVFDDAETVSLGDVDHDTFGIED